MIYPVDSAIQCLIKRGQLSMRVIFFVLAAPTLGPVRERGESGKGGKGSPTLFIAFVLVEGFISKYLKSHVYGKRQIEKFSNRKWAYKNSSNSSPV